MTDEQPNDLDQLTVLNPHWPDEGIPVFGPPPEPARLDGDWTMQWCEDHQQAINDWMNTVLPEVLQLLPEELRSADLDWVEPHFSYTNGNESGILGFTPPRRVTRAAIERYAVEDWALITPEDPEAPDAKHVNSLPEIVHPASTEAIEFHLDFQLPWAWTTPLPITCDNPDCGCRDWLAAQKEDGAKRAKELDDKIVRINPFG